jgi:hypothetical protein
LKRRLIITLNMTKVVQHLWEAIRFENTENLEPIFDRDRPIRSTGDMGIWYTGKPCEGTKRSHINFCVYDSTWEASESFELDHNSEVDAWVKNDHLGFEILYVYRGVVRKYRPDFIIRLKSGNYLVLDGGAVADFVLVISGSRRRPRRSQVRGSASPRPDRDSWLRGRRVPSSVTLTRTREVFLNYAHLREAGDSRPAGRHCGHAWISTR